MDRSLLLTERLMLSPVRWADAERLAVLHADARVMRLLKHGVLDRAASDALVADYEAEWPAFGFGSWTVVERASGRLIGLGGLRLHNGDLGGGFGVALRAAFVPEAQGQGYGPEFSRAALTYAFAVAGLDRVVAITREDNAASQRALEKIGMQLERRFMGENGRTLRLYVALAEPPAEFASPACLLHEMG